MGEPSPIKYVFYVLKENRTYDQVLGDLSQGNGDTSLCLFGAGVTPNEHALASEFVLLDNFYVDAEVGADGHNWSMAGYATDFTEKTWPSNYSGRGNLDTMDIRREQVFESDFDSLVKIAAVPHFNTIYLPNDHTSGLSKGDHTPVAMIADNDLALGRLVDHISHSPIWRSSGRWN